MTTKIRETLELLFLSLIFLIFSSAAQESLFRDASGQEGKYTIERPSSASKVGVLVYFHGSGSTSAYAANFVNLAKVARRFDLVPVALQAPNGSVTWAENGPPSGRIPYAQELLKKEVFGKSPNLDVKKTVFVGISAGATFIAGDFLPKHLKIYGGGAVLLCGGASPIYPQKVDANRKDFKMFMAIHPSDFLFAQTIMGADFWRDRGLNVKVIQPLGSGHCGFDLNATMSEGISFVLDK